MAEPTASEALGAMASDLLDLLDRIEIEDDASLAGQRFEIAKKHGFEVTFQPVDAGAARTQ